MTEAAYSDTWVVLPTFNEAENLPGISAAILERLPGGTLLVVDDSSPDGTDDTADRMASRVPRIWVHHRPGKQGLGKAYIDGFRVALAGGAGRVVQMDADWSHNPQHLPALPDGLAGGSLAPEDADLMIGSRYARGGGVLEWGVGRRVISRGGSLFARFLLGLTPHDLTAASRRGVGPRSKRLTASGPLGWLRLPDRDHLPRDACRGARGRDADHLRRPTRGRELVVVLKLRWDELRGRGPKRPRRSASAASANRNRMADRSTTEPWRPMAPAPCSNA